MRSLTISRYKRKITRLNIPMKCKICRKFVVSSRIRTVWLNMLKEKIPLDEQALNPVLEYKMASRYIVCCLFLLLFLLSIVKIHFYDSVRNTFKKKKSKYNKGRKERSVKIICSYPHMSALLEWYNNTKQPHWPPLSHRNPRRPPKTRDSAERGGPPVSPSRGLEPERRSFSLLFQTASECTFLG